MTDTPTAAAHADFAHPERLVTTEWLAVRLAAGEAGAGTPIAVLESDEDVLLYDSGHIPGSLKLDWVQDLNDPVTRDYIDGARFAEVMNAPRRVVDMPNDPQQVKDFIVRTS